MIFQELQILYYSIIYKSYLMDVNFNNGGSIL